jgi:hypothetical protein
MTKFGEIKSKIEKTGAELFGKSNFQKFMFGFKSNILENKDLSEIFYIYEDLSTKKGLHKDLANDYVNESIEYCQILLENNYKNLTKVDKWLSSFSSEYQNNYKDIDTIIYNNSIKNLETVLESKKKVINTIISENKVTKVNESINLPISTMIKVAESELGKEISTLSESEQKEVTSILNLSKDELKVEFNTIKETVISNLNNSLNESKEDDIKKMISQTIDKVNESNCTHYDLYKLKKLSLGL